MLGWTDARGQEVWDVDGQFNMELLRAFSSMNSPRLAPTGGGGSDAGLDGRPGLKSGTWTASSVWSCCAPSRP